MTAYALAFGSFLASGAGCRTSSGVSELSSLAWPDSQLRLPSADSLSILSCWFRLERSRGCSLRFSLRRCWRSLPPRSPIQTNGDEPLRSTAQSQGPVARSGLFSGVCSRGTRSWRWTLFVNLVFAAFAVTGASMWLKGDHAADHDPLDLPGLATAT